MPDPRVHVSDLQVLHDDAHPRVVLAALPPVYAQGLRLVLQDSSASCLVVDDLAQLPALLAGTHTMVVVVPAAAGAEVLALAGASPTGVPHPVVVLLDRVTLDASTRALRAGATGVLAMSADPRDVVAVLRCAARGQTVLARPLVQAMLGPTALPPPSLSSVEQTWLRRLAAGATVAGLARACDYSEREMYRRLSTVYQHLGARTRTEALLLAERFGLLDDGG